MHLNEVPSYDITSLSQPFLSMLIRMHWRNSCPLPNINIQIDNKVKLYLRLTGWCQKEKKRNKFPSCMAA